jgi:hypothetical protein
VRAFANTSAQGFISSNVNALLNLSSVAKWLRLGFERMWGTGCQKFSANLLVATGFIKSKKCAVLVRLVRLCRIQWNYMSLQHYCRAGKILKNAHPGHY